MIAAGECQLARDKADALRVLVMNDAEHVAILHIGRWVSRLPSYLEA